MTHTAVVQFALVCCLSMVLPARAAEPASAPQTSQEIEALPTRTLLSTTSTATGQPIRYPQDAVAHVTALEITLAPGQETGWHKHAVPMFCYILAGELTVDYGAKGRRTYRTGDAFVEAMNEAHDGHNTGREPTRILAFVAGAEGVMATVLMRPPALAQPAR